MSCASSNAERLLSPRRGLGVCPRCLNLTDAEGLCRACRASENHLAAIVPISYSVGGEWLHRVIASYKRDADPSVPAALSMLSRLCSEFVSRHELCVARAVGVQAFDVVTTVPSADLRRDARHPLRRIVGELMEPTRDRYERLLIRTPAAAVPRVFDAGRYEATRRLTGEAILLIDDMWTSGASAQSAGAALVAAGAGQVAAVVVARHLNRGWHENDVRLRRLMREDFDLSRCALCANPDGFTAVPAAASLGSGPPSTGQSGV